MKIFKYLVLVFVITCFSCIDDDVISTNSAPQLIIKFKFDETQERLGSLGLPTTVALGNAAQSPNFNTMSAHYLELAPSALTALGAGEIIYDGLETTNGGTTAVDFQQAKIVAGNENFLSIPLSSLQNGTYEWVRSSLTYQNYDIVFLFQGIDYTGTLASFVGFNNYITSHDINGNAIVVNDNKLQGYWAFETNGIVSEGQTFSGATTVPNPISTTSPIPVGSCVVTGQFSNGGLTITGNETSDIIVTLSLSINNSFEWTEVNVDGKFEPDAGETVVDMGFRGLIPIVN